MKRYAILLTLVVSLLLAQTAAADLVTNGDFEAGSPSGPPYVTFPSWTMTGAVHIGPNNFEFVDDYWPHNGNYGAWFGLQFVTGAGGIAQTFTTTPGQSYNVQFWLANDGAAAPPVEPNLVVVSWAGSPQITLTNIAAQDYQSYSFAATALGGSTTLEFSFLNEPGFFYLDDVSVNPVPIPGSVVLLGSGLIGLLGWRRVRKS